MRRSTDRPEERRRGDLPWPDILLPVAFYLLFLVQLTHHELWRDELNALGLALASPTVDSLFHHVRYEGHPWLWYFLLWTIGRFTASVASLKLLEACIVAASYGLLGWCSPFSRAEKTLLFLGYFISFEYAVLSRMYSLLLLFTLIYLWRCSTYPEQVFANCVLLSLLPSTDIMGLILSCGLLVEYALFRYSRLAKNIKGWLRELVPGSVAFVAVAAFAVWSSRPATDMGWRTTGRPFDHLFDGAHLVASATSFIAMPFVSVSFGHSGASFWNPTIAQHPAVYLACLPVVLLAYCAIFRRQRSLLVLVSCVLLLSTAFGHLVYLGTMRHWGVTFLGFLAALWLLKRAGRPLPLSATLLLGASALCGIYTAWAQWQHPFSNAELTAAWLRAHHLENAPISGTPDTTVASLAVLLRRPVYMLDCECSDSYVLFSRRRDSFSRTKIPDRLVNARHELGNDLIYIDTHALSPDLRTAFLKRGLAAEELSRLTGSAFAGEDFFIYSIHAVVPEY